jgi:hypothetical protein
VPVFYSYFEDLQETTVFRRVGAGLKGLRDRLPKRRREAVVEGSVL